MTHAWTFAPILVVFLGCSTDSSGGAENAGGDGGGTTGGDGGASASCATDPLKTGLTAQQTGVSVDAFDCEILKWTASTNEPDAMIFKAIIYVESRFDDTSVACPNLPCGTPSGWTAAESGCYGLMQVVPACGDQPNNVGLLPNGHPNLTTDSSASGWATSIFNPDVNIETGISGVAGNRAQVMKQFPGCTTEQYTLMASAITTATGAPRAAPSTTPTTTTTCSTPTISMPPRQATPRTTTDPSRATRRRPA